MQQRWRGPSWYAWAQYHVRDSRLAWAFGRQKLCCSVDTLGLFASTRFTFFILASSCGLNQFPAEQSLHRVTTHRMTGNIIPIYLFVFRLTVIGSKALLIGGNTNSPTNTLHLLDLGKFGKNVLFFDNFRNYRVERIGRFIEDSLLTHSLVVV